MRPNMRCLERCSFPGRVRLNLITFVSFPPSANNESLAGAHSHNHEYFIQTLTQKTQNNSASQRHRLASAVIVRLLIFMSLRFLSFNDPLADHLFQKMMFAPPYVQDIYDAAFLRGMDILCRCLTWLWIISTLTYFPGAAADQHWVTSHEYTSRQFHLSRIVTRVTVSRMWRESLWRRPGGWDAGPGAHLGPRGTKSPHQHHTSLRGH